MTNKPKPLAKADDPAESKRFIDMAREVEVDERPEAFERAFKRVIPQVNGQKLPAAKKDQ
jgi:hypothetical protein